MNETHNNGAAPVYDGSSIVKLSDRDHVRERTGMYIGRTDEGGLHHLAWEGIDNAVDEFNAGFCTRIDVTLHSDGSITIADNGRGIPTAINPQFNIPAVTIAVSMLNAGGKFNTNVYATSGGTHGIGIKACNFLSTKFSVTVMQNGQIFRQRFRDGFAEEDLTVIGETDKTGTVLHFNPDRKILHTVVTRIDPETKVETEETVGVDFNRETILRRLKALAYLNVGLTVSLTDERLPESDENRYFSMCADNFEGIVADIQQDELGEKTDPENLFVQPISFSSIEEVREKTISVSVALNISGKETGCLRSYVNSISTVDGGTHERGFRQGLLRALNKYNDAQEISRHPFVAEDVADGVFAAVSIRIPTPKFTSQDKVKLDSPEATTAVQRSVMTFLERFFEENPKEADRWMGRVLLAQKSRLAAKRSREIVRKENGPVSRMSLPGKLAGCESRDPSVCEIFLVEGDSAGGSAKNARDRKFQAILPLRGKITNVGKADEDAAFDSAEINAITSALGVPLSTDGEINLDKLRYHKICIMADADVDGEHISALLLTFFHTYMRPLIENGYVYICMPPLFRLDPKAKKQPHFYIQNQSDLDAFLSEHSQEDYTISRFKGLGEMNPEQLAETTLNPDSRTLLQVFYSDKAPLKSDFGGFDLTRALAAIPAGMEEEYALRAEYDEEGFPIPLEQRVSEDTIFKILMGAKVPPRRAFIESNAVYADDVS